MMKESGLAVVASLAIPEALTTHRFVREAVAVAATLAANDDPKRQVNGTSYLPDQLQLYGWNTNIGRHSDNTGYLYGLCLNEGTTTLFAQDETCTDPGPTLAIELVQGTVFRLFDGYTHWTQDTGPRIAAFLGPLMEPDDEKALCLFNEALTELAGHAYYTSPRISDGFVVQGDDECLATVDFLSYERMLKSDARKRDAFILNCGECGAPALIVDQHWPIYEDRSACANCMTLDAEIN
ncbi:hypothetical protein [Pseudomonas sp. NPDC089569]|uniref:hypothetical protein n=1 Tax=Pseudomonas sp. NPDC089569 TaxID=3390722 RepID=UPI003D00DF18